MLAVSTQVLVTPVTLAVHSASGSARPYTSDAWHQTDLHGRFRGNSCVKTVLPCHKCLVYMQVASAHTEPQTPDTPHPTQAQAQSPSLSGSDSPGSEALLSGSATAVDPHSATGHDTKGA